MNSKNPFNLKIGDRLIREKDPFFKHHGLVIGFYSDGSPKIAECQIVSGVSIVDFKTFMNRKSSFWIEPYNFNLYSIKEIQIRVEERLGLPYDLSNYNCEIFVNEVLFNRTNSPQVRNGTIAFSLGLLFLFNRSNNKSKRA